MFEQCPFSIDFNSVLILFLLLADYFHTADYIVFSSFRCNFFSFFLLHNQINVQITGGGGGGNEQNWTTTSFSRQMCTFCLKRGEEGLQSEENNQRKGIVSETPQTTAILPENLKLVSVATILGQSIKQQQQQQ